MLSRIKIVLVDTSHPGNIGACARALKTMSLQHLVLVNPRRYPSAEATARASGAGDLLARSQVCDSLDQALENCQLVFGASARLRNLPWPILDPRQCAAKIAAEANTTQVAIVFGREHSGLTNSEMAKCHYLVNIPSNPECSSLNVAAAVQIIAYELATAALEPSSNVGTRIDAVSTYGKFEPLATGEDMERFYSHLFSVLDQIEFLDQQHHDKMKRRLRRLFNRSRPDRVEMNILRGILSLVQKKLS
jgi:tRNA (cytidine32/uridine32-2'-O)-methyltransferase